MEKLNVMIQVQEDKLAYLENLADELVKEIQALNTPYDMMTFAPSKLERLKDVQKDAASTYETIKMLKSLKEEN